jgi:hypothetical protein
MKLYYLQHFGFALTWVSFERSHGVTIGRCLPFLVRSAIGWKVAAPAWRSAMRAQMWSTSGAR